MAAAMPGVTAPSDDELRRMVSEVASDGKKITVDDFAALLTALDLPAMDEGAIAASS